MKKLMAVMLSCALVVTALMGLSITASAEGTPIVFTAQSVEAKAGDTITVDISVSENHYMVNGQIWVEYDPTALEIQEVWDDPDNPYFEDINTKIFKSTYMWAFAVSEPGRAKMAFATSSSTGTTAGGVMFTLTFKVLDDAKTSAIKVSVPDNDMNANDGTTKGGADYDVDVSFVDGTITIPSDVNVLLGDVNCDGVVNMSDATRLFYCVNGLLNLTDEQLVNADNNGDGVVNMSDATRLFYCVNGLLTL